MQTVDVNSITDYIAGTFENKDDQRASEVMIKLIQALHNYIREVNLTHAEWDAALQFLRAVGDKTTDHRDEFMLLSDVTGATSLVDILAGLTSPEATAASPRGPYYLPNAPLVEQGALICREDEPGTPAIFKGRVIDLQGRAIKGALLDIWHNADSGLYSNEDESQDDINNRGRIHTDENGEFRVRTIRPRPYPIPMDGPVGAMMTAFGRSPWRSAHFHIIVSADGYEPITTELFFSDCEYIDTDAVAGVRSSLVHQPIYATTERGKTLIVDHQFCLRK